MEQFNRKPSFEIRRVYAYNLVSEFRLIDSLIEYYANIAINVKFPGACFKSASPSWHLPPRKAYELMKATVDGMKIIQFGLALFDNKGEFAGNHYRGNPFGPVLYVWEFNFKDFNKNLNQGIDSSDFAKVFMTSKLATFPFKDWITFHGLYDLGFLVKVLNHGRLPDSIEEFHGCQRLLCHGGILDIKQIVYAEYGFRGDLENLAKLLNVERPWGESHQAGSDCLLIALTAMEFIMKKKLVGAANAPRHVGALFGLGSLFEFPPVY